MQIQRNVVLTATEFNDIFQAISLVIKQLKLNVSEILSLSIIGVYLPCW